MKSVLIKTLHQEKEMALSKSRIPEGEVCEGLRKKVTEEVLKNRVIMSWEKISLQEIRESISV